MGLGKDALTQAGQEKYRSLVRIFFLEVLAVFLVYSTDDKYSFLALGAWLKDVREKAPEDVIIILIGNKNDLKRQVDYDEGVEFMKQNKLDMFFETSAKTGQNVSQVGGS